MKFSIVFLVGSLALVGCSNNNPLHPESTTTAPSAGLSAAPPATAVSGQLTPDAWFGFNGVVSRFPNGEVFVSGGGTFDLATGFVRSSGGFSCVDDVAQGPLSMPKNAKGPCLQGQGVRWDTAE